MAVDSQFSTDVDQFDLSIAAINGPKQLVISGSTKQIEKAKVEAMRRKLSTKIISEEYAFHSKLVKEKHLKQLQHFNWSKVQNQPQNEMKIISNVSAEPLVEFNRQYVKEQATSTVQFWKSIENLLAEGEITVLEVGPGRILSSLTQKILNERSLRYLVLNTIQKDQDNELDTVKCKSM
jgi:trans-AT polyketide synthase/acyltransferase/oxidoreductase domain-containing protein